MFVPYLDIVKHYSNVAQTLLPVIAHGLKIPLESVTNESEQKVNLL